MANALHEVWAELVAQAWTDSAFKQKLVADPSRQLQEHGITVPSDLNVEVVEGGKLIERNGNVLRLPLPELREGEQSDEELNAVVGGVSSLRSYFLRSFSSSAYAATPLLSPTVATFPKSFYS